MDNPTKEVWTKWTPPYDPRRADGCDVYEDEHGRLIEAAFCGTRCPGCGICCKDYRDVITSDYQGVEEFSWNQKSEYARGGLVKIEDGRYYRAVDCGEGCPGYGQCCPPFDLRDRPQSVEDAARILLERDDGMLWEMHAALLILAHDGSDEAVQILEQYLPQAHHRLEGFAECALEEGRFFNESPMTEFEERQQMKCRVRESFEDRLIEMEAEIDEEILPEIDRLRYELEIARRVMEKTSDDCEEVWRTQVDVYEMLVGRAEGRLEELGRDINRYEAMIAEIDVDLEQQDSEVDAHLAKYDGPDEPH